MHNINTRADAESAARRVASVNPLQLSTASVLRVGEGRGFIVEDLYNPMPDTRVIISGAHCLPHLPPAHALSYLRDRTYQNLLRSLDGSKKDIWAECLFVDLVADIAVLGCPDSQALGEEAERYEALVGTAPALQMAVAHSGPGWMLSLDNRWVPITLEVHSSLTIDATEGGQSGSPILDAAGRAVGVIVVGNKVNSAGQPILARNLPAWLAPRSR